MKTATIWIIALIALPLVAVIAWFLLIKKKATVATTTGAQPVTNAPAQEVHSTLVQAVQAAPAAPAQALSDIAAGASILGNVDGIVDSFLN